MLRQQVRSDVRIHGIILSGGAAANIIPDYAAIRYRTRADDTEYLAEVVERVIACAEGAARATGCRLEWNEYMPGYENTMPNSVLMDLMVANLRGLGLNVNTSRKRAGARLDRFRQRLAAGAGHRGADRHHRADRRARPLGRIQRSGRLGSWATGDAERGQVAGDDRDRPARRAREPAPSAGAIRGGPRATVILRRGTSEGLRMSSSRPAEMPDCSGCKLRMTRPRARGGLRGKR